MPHDFISLTNQITRFLTLLHHSHRNFVNFLSGEDKNDGFCTSASAAFEKRYDSCVSWQFVSTKRFWKITNEILCYEIYLCCGRLKQMLPILYFRSNKLFPSHPQGNLEFLQNLRLRGLTTDHFSCTFEREKIPLDTSKCTLATWARLDKRMKEVQ